MYSPLDLLLNRATYSKSFRKTPQALHVTTSQPFQSTNSVEYSSAKQAPTTPFHGSAAFAVVPPSTANPFLSISVDVVNRPANQGAKQNPFSKLSKHICSRPLNTPSRKGTETPRRGMDTARKIGRILLEVEMSNTPSRELQRESTGFESALRRGNDDSWPNQDDDGA